MINDQTVLPVLESWLCLMGALLVALSSLMVYLSTTHRTEKQELHALHQLIIWSIAGFSMVLPLFSANRLLSRLTSIFLGFAPSFFFLSIGYEAIFYAALVLLSDVRTSLTGTPPPTTTSRILLHNSHPTTFHRQTAELPPTATRTIPFHLASNRNSINLQPPLRKSAACM